MSTVTKRRTNRKSAPVPWHDNDTFWQTFKPIMFTAERLENAESEVESIVSLLDLHPGMKVLDLCCGPGRHSVALARRGLQVTGVDLSPGYLAAARKRAKAEKISVEFIHEDARRFRRRNAFDCAINLLTSFGYFVDPKENRKVLRNLHASLKKGGRLVMDLMGKEILARVFRERDWHEENGLTMLEERKIARDWTWIENRWILLDQKGRRQEYDVSHYLYSAEELMGMLEECGFRSTSSYGDFDGAPYDHAAKRLMVVARK